MPNIILISGKKQHGKTTLADFISGSFGYKKLPFASGLKFLDSMFREKLEIEAKKNDINKALVVDKGIESTLKDMGLDNRGLEVSIYNEYVNNPEFMEQENGKFRRALQILGTDILRTKDPYCHVRFVCNFINRMTADGLVPHDFVIDDARFENEINMRNWEELPFDAKRYKWHNVLVHRVGYESDDTHASEQIPMDANYNSIVLAKNKVELFTGALISDLGEFLK